jgi:hypothetical protein
MPFEQGDAIPFGQPGRAVGVAPILLRMPASSRCFASRRRDGSLLSLDVAMRVWLHTLRSVIILVGTAAAFAVSFTMMQRAIGSSSPWLGLLGMLYLLGLAKVAEPLFLLQMPTTLRAVRPWEKDGGVYRRLLIPSFGRLLRGTPLRFLNPAVYLAQKQPDLIKVYRQVEAAEAAHFWAALLFAPYVGYVWLSGHFREAMVFLFVQIFFNIYPILHLRIVRGRLDRLVQRQLLRDGRVSVACRSDA